MINILEILKKIPNLEDMVFYSPLYGDVRVKIDESNYPYPIRLYENTGNYSVGTLTESCRFLIGKDACTECMLYPSRQNRDWSTFKVPRKDLPRDINVMVTRNPKNGWELRKYAGNKKCYSIFDDFLTPIDWEYIIPINKFNFDSWKFNEEDNYGTAHKE